MPPERDLSGQWIDGFTGIAGARITGEHLALPGYDGVLPTLEIFSYSVEGEDSEKRVNRFGYGHIAFEVEDVEATLAARLEAGGGQVGTVERRVYPDGRTATLVYATDVEGNIIELQNWK